MRIAIFCPKKDQESIDYLSVFIKELLKRNQSVLLHYDLLENTSLQKNSNETLDFFKTHEDLKSKSIDVVFSFGGDGTILSALTIIQDLEIPVLGINLGRLGFLASFSKEDAIQNIDLILQKEKFQITERSLLKIECKSKNILFPFALNDICITRKETTSMISIDAYMNNELISVFWSDGLIISTPTGSTAYSMSCGGPIIFPSSNNFVITPIAPHNLNVRPIVITDDVCIKLKVESRVQQYTLSLDSRLFDMDIEDEIYIKKADFSLKLVQPMGNDFFTTLRKKLFWGKDKRN